MAKEIIDHEYTKPVDMRHIDLTPDDPDVTEIYPNQRRFWLQRRWGDPMVQIGFPETMGFISREHDLEELIEALEELRDFEPEE
jgi:hypothetical protein